MIPRNDARCAPSALILAPKYKGAELPAWSPSAPRSGWTPTTAWAAALAYADENSGTYTEGVLATAAYRALLGAFPGLHSADVVARLQGADPRQF